MKYIGEGVNVHGPDDSLTDSEVHITAITQASATSPATDRLEDVGESSQTVTSAIPTECGWPKIHPGDRSAPLMARCNQDNDNGDAMQDSGNAAVDATANEADVTSHAIVEAENANGLSQASAAAVPDELHDHEALFDDMATNTEDCEDEDGSMTPRNSGAASSTARSDGGGGDDNDGAFPLAGVGALTDPTVPGDSPTNRQSKCL
ncbi:hypothetical protein EIP86_001536 [Pleurotus ostreatoroseus]|nr:hypothetical protein EIP86_001536 [Pleurotus ostreatoroseus]